jgi:non-ribosomal peptide synthetase component E (peptide arylation enzyme)
MGEGLFAVARPGAPREARLSTVCTPLSLLDEAHILEPDGERELPDGEVGELCCTGPYTLRGYFDVAEHSRTAFTSDGLYRTGDLAAVRSSTPGGICPSRDVSRTSSTAAARRSTPRRWTGAPRVLDRREHGRDPARQPY